MTNLLSAFNNNSIRFLSLTIFISLMYFVYLGEYIAAILALIFMVGSLFFSTSDASKEYETLKEQIKSVTNQAAHGELEARVLNIDEELSLAPIAQDINSLLDQIEVLIRESIASIQAATNGVDQTS